VLLALDRRGNDLAVHLQVLARPLLRRDRDLVHVFVLLEALAEGGVHQRRERAGDHQDRHDDLQAFVAHK
jgi:hypothetical protein